MDGATAFYPIYAAVGDAVYRMENREDLKNFLKCSRTPDAWERLVDGKVDVAFLLRPSERQEETARIGGVSLDLTSVAREAFVFFVNERNPVNNLSVEQIKDIYRKKIVNWRQVGGSNRRIFPFQRPENSDSQTTMLHAVMKGEKLPAPFQTEYAGTMGRIVHNVATYRDIEEAIGYSFRFFTREMIAASASLRERSFPTPVEGRVKLLSIEGVAPTEENIRNGSYPFTAEIYAATAGTKNPHVRELIDWLTSAEGQSLIERTGYVGIK
jgi:phosphate transport system substrate-binding protein